MSHVYEALNADDTLIVVGPGPDTRPPLNVVAIGAIHEVSIVDLDLTHQVSSLYRLNLRRPALQPSDPAPSLESLLAQAADHFRLSLPNLGIGVIARGRDGVVARALWLEPAATHRFGVSVSARTRLFLDTLEVAVSVEPWDITGRKLADLGVEEWAP